MTASRPWEDVRVSLWVSGAALDPATVTDALGLPPAVERAPGPGGEHGLWGFTVTPDAGSAGDAGAEGVGAEGVGGDPVAKGLDALGPALFAPHALPAPGSAVRLEIAGHIASGARLQLTPDTLARIAATGAALSLTTYCEPSPGREEDMADWFPAPDGSHRAP